MSSTTSQTGGLNTLIQNIGSGADTSMQSVADLSNTMDVTSPADAAKMQLAMMKMNVGFQLEASIVKNFEDMLKAITQRM